MFVAEATVSFATSETEKSYEMSSFARGIYEAKYSFENQEDWPDTAERVAKNVLGALGYVEEDKEYKEVRDIITDRKFIPAGRYLYAAGRELHQVNNCYLCKAEDSREGWADLGRKAFMVLQTGGGFGADYSNVRAAGTPIRKTGGTASGPLPLMNVINEIGRGVMQGGSRRSAILASLNWKHQDIFDFIRVKDWSPKLRELKADDMTFPAPMDMTNISVGLDDEFFEAYNNPSNELHEHAVAVYNKVCDKMLTTAEPGFTVDTGENAGEILRNPCGEITSKDDSDVCNLGSINIAAFDNIFEFRKAVINSILFLLAGTVYSHLAYDEVYDVRSKNRRIGLGLMGIHEWLVKRGYGYEPNDELGKWLEVYEEASRIAADEFSFKHQLTNPVKVRSIAPTGSISIIAETTSGIEPIFAVAYKRRIRIANAIGEDHVEYEYVIDPTAKRLIASGATPESIEDAYSLSYDYEKRIAMQAFIQKYVDHAISSTINLPEPITDEKEQEKFRNILMKYLPHLRGITCYPNGARGGQPLSVVPYGEAVEQQGVRYMESEETCVGGVCAL